MFKIIQKETQNHAITRISLCSWCLKAFDKQSKKVYTSSVLLKFVILETDKKRKT